jgi:hypothetical protein
MTVTQLVQKFYASLEWLQGSLLPLLALGIILLVVVALAAREFVSWFIKVQKIREEIRSLEKLCLEVLGEVRDLKSEIHASGGLFREEARLIEKPRTPPPRREISAARPSIADRSGRFEPVDL